MYYQSLANAGLKMTAYEVTFKSFSVCVADPAGHAQFFQFQMKHV